jgi:hypothetical protein
MTYLDTYLSGQQTLVEGVIGTNAGSILAVIGPRMLDGIMHACVRQAGDAEPLEMPPGAAQELEELLQYPETAQVVLGGFMAEPESEDAGDIPLPVKAKAAPKPEKRGGKR